MFLQAAVATSSGEHGSSGKVDCIVAGAGTGGTVTGLSRCLKRTHNPECLVIAIDPMGSILAPDDVNERAGQHGVGTYQVEGIGYDFIPKVMDREDVDVWIKVNDSEAFATARAFIREEALLVGGSSGSALAGALKYLKSPEGFERLGGVEGKNVVVILPDGIRNYMSKPWFLSPQTTESTPLATAIASVLEKAAVPKPIANGITEELHVKPNGLQSAV